MKTCQNDKRVTETIYPNADYVEERDSYGQRVFLTLKPNHSPGLTITRIIQCEVCQTERAKPDIQKRLKDAQELEAIRTEADTMRANNTIAKSLGLSVRLSVNCTKCGEEVPKFSKGIIRNDKTRDPLCANCYKEHRRDYMRDLMRAKRETNHVA